MQYYNGAFNLSGNYPKVVKQIVNLGSLPYFSDCDAKGQRTIAFHEDHLVKPFPRVLSLVRVQDALVKWHSQFGHLLRDVMLSA
jgi:hypothetical protein